MRFVDSIVRTASPGTPHPATCLRAPSHRDRRSAPPRVAGPGVVSVRVRVGISLDRSLLRPPRRGIRGELARVDLSARTFASLCTSTWKPTPPLSACGNSTTKRGCPAPPGVLSCRVASPRSHAERSCGSWRGAWRRAQSVEPVRCARNS